MLSTPTAIADWNGGNSTVFSLASEWSREGKSRWESVAVSPCPGKCLAVVNTSVDFAPWIKATVKALLLQEIHQKHECLLQDYLDYCLRLPRGQIAS